MAGCAADGAAPDVAGCAAIFLPARTPRAGAVAFWRPDGGPLPDTVAGATEGDAGQEARPQGEVARLTVARRHGNGARSRTVPALVLPLPEAVPVLVRARHAPDAHPAAACWGAATLHALHLAARGRLLPGLTGEDADAWRAGPLDPDDVAHLRAIAAAMPGEAYAAPLPGSRPLQLPDPAALVRAFVDAVVDTLPRTPAAALVAAAPFAATAPQHLPAAREWAAEVAAGTDAGVGLSLRLDLAPHQLFDGRGRTRPRRRACRAGPGERRRPEPPRSAAPGRRSSRSTATPTRPWWPTPASCGKARRPTPSARDPAPTRSSRYAGPPVSGLRSAAFWSAPSPTCSRSARTSCTTCWPRRRGASAPPGWPSTGPGS
ncbi:hypothetical protein [Streptomyces noursei]|uniref:hypothetical protein n=1 Tax=Streptomyces noursei TaxID=1971 RepID=UPI0035574CA5